MSERGAEAAEAEVTEPGVTDADAAVTAEGIAADAASEGDADSATVEEIVVEPDPELLSSHDFARAALAEITDAETIGGNAGHDVHDAMTVTLYFECLTPGYPGWRWAAALAKVSDDAPVTVLEVELLPGDGAVLAPEWVPWSERLAQYREGQAQQTADEEAQASEAAEELADMDDVDSDDDLMENDFSDFDDELDGVDIDELDDDSDDDDSDDDDSGDEDSDDEDSDDDDFDDESDDESDDDKEDDDSEE